VELEKNGATRLTAKDASVQVVTKDVLLTAIKAGPHLELLAVVTKVEQIDPIPPVPAHQATEHHVLQAAATHRALQAVAILHVRQAVVMVDLDPRAADMLDSALVRQEPLVDIEAQEALGLP